MYGIVKQHNGYIRIESAVGAGAAVRIYLPRVATVTDSVAAPESDPPPVAASETVLVVEDEGELRELTTEVLGIAGYSVLSAGSPSEALEIARRHPGPIHLLLTDVVMPETSGRDLADRLVPARPGMKVLYMSRYTDDAIVHHGVLDPGTVLLQKPFTPDGLTPDGGRRADALATAGARRAGRFPRHECTAERRRLLRVGVECGLEPRERPVAPREADGIDREVVHEARVEDVLHVAARADAGRRLLREPEQRAKGRHVSLEHGLVPEVSRHLGKAREELVDRHLPGRRTGAVVEVAREADLHGQDRGFSSIM